jgi:hypothetical protein
LADEPLKLLLLIKLHAGMNEPGGANVITSVIPGQDECVYHFLKRDALVLAYGGEFFVTSLDGFVRL